MTAAQVHRASSAVWSQFPAKWGPDGDAHVYMAYTQCVPEDTILSQCARLGGSSYHHYITGNHLFLTCSVTTAEEEDLTPASWIIVGPEAPSAAIANAIASR